MNIAVSPAVPLIEHAGERIPRPAAAGLRGASIGMNSKRLDGSKKGQRQAWRCRMVMASWRWPASIRRHTGFEGSSERPFGSKPGY